MRRPTGWRRRATRPFARRRDDDGQALIELVLVLPLVALILGAGFNGWNAMQFSVRLTSAARAGAIKAANDLGTNPTQLQTAWDDATTAVNQEEGVVNMYQDQNSAADNYVRMSEKTDSVPGGSSINVVTITITRNSVTLIPVIGNLHVSVQAAARYS